MKSKSIQEILRDVNKFRTSSHKIFAIHESSSKSRKVLLEQTKKKLTFLSLEQHSLLEESLNCIEFGLYRGACILSWIAFIDFLQKKISEDNLKKINSIRKGWNKYKTLAELKENIPEFQFIEVARDIKFITKAESRSIFGLLSKRNECAHPGGYCPNLNESIGYVSEIINRIDQLKDRTVF